MSDTKAPSRPLPKQHGLRAQSTVPEETVPGIPGWMRDWGFLLIGAVALGVLVAAAYVGQTYGATYGWALVVIAACAAAALWWQDYTRREEAAKVRRDQKIYESHEIEKVDLMTGARFETYCADLLRALGYHQVTVIGSTPGEDGADIIAIDPRGTQVAVQCKRQAVKVGPVVIRELAGALTGPTHRDRRGIVMTNAFATTGAHAWADDAGILLVDRPVLQQWMSQARTGNQTRDEVKGTAPTGRLRRMRPEAKATTAVLSAGIVLLIVIAFQQPLPRSLAKVTQPGTPPASAGPAAVVREVFAAINAHNWRELWRLSSHPKYHRAEAYRKMISGYRLTARDVITSLQTHGQIVTARVNAYETTGIIQTYVFTYTVHGRKIVRGHTALLDTRHS